MSDSDTPKIQELKRRLAGAEYEVDPRAVADALLRRDATRRLLLAGLPARRGGVSFSSGLSPASSPGR
ncbi:MAG TPA: flagellar biosynthesis anti-sigma factor FlgM [Solirubrobacteraceae bacterium]|jgi:hypothetical protein|nr:flagellar biosynthesis anti-sigma factor FlgM [Solirubrobacteraceae bacterium]